MGQQVLEAGLATPKGYVPLDSPIYVSDTKVCQWIPNFKDERSAVAKDCHVATTHTKNQMFRQMLKRIIRKKNSLTHVSADSWFGNKDNIKSVLDLGLHGVFRMKKAKLKFRINNRDLTISEIHALIHRRMKCAKGEKYRCFTLNVHLNLSAKTGIEDWTEVKLLFSAPKNQTSKDQWAGEHSRAIYSNTHDGI